MGHNTVDKYMKIFESYKNINVAPDSYIVVRLDGVSFSKVTKRLKLSKPYDQRFMDLMVATTNYVMDNVPDIEIGYTQSDEITLVFRQDTNYFSRRVEKIASVLAARASSYLSVQLNEPVAFDGRISSFPSLQLVEDNLNWRIADSAKNCLNLHTFWALINGGMTKRQATKAMLNQGAPYYIDCLKSRGINFNEDVNLQQKRGTLLYRVARIHNGYDPSKQQATTTTRSSIVSDTEIPDTRKVSLLDYVKTRQLGLVAQRGT